jgi:hypothetical protein
MEMPFQHITISLPEGYTQADADRLRAQFPGIKTILDARAFCIEEEAEGETPSPLLKAVFSWVDLNL